MHDIKWIREAPGALIGALTRRGGGSEAAELVQGLLALDEERRATLTRLEGLLARRNAASKEIGQAKAQKDEAKASALMAEVAKLKEDVPALEAEVKRIDASLEAKLAGIPNVPLAEVPDGKDEHDNVPKSAFGEKRAYAFAPKQHFEIGEALGQMDFETAAKLSGARFVVNKGPLARLERALGQFFLDVHTSEHGYMEVNPPLLVRDEAMFGTAQLPKFEEDQFAATNIALMNERLRAFPINEEQIRKIVWEQQPPKAGLGAIPPETFELIEAQVASVVSEMKAFTAEVVRKSASHWLIPTAEVPLTNLVRDSILSEEELPLRLTACTPCFRAEAGAAGRDTRGMIRQHQFTKVELVSITTPEKSLEEHERMLACAEAVLQKLDLHYRVVTLCTGDMGFASQKTYDIEVWLPGQGAYREISSCSVCGDFQARRMNARYRPAEGKGPRFVHTLNGSGVAVGRALVAVMETYQQENGAIAVPEALKPYMGGLALVEKLK
ncbi:serine--tRNA ligase [Xanthobacter tagetidis]|uniref:Serine--tRNA ligase n=1 Tax=Xanthobacter tagetidis TaxID=60216 RepID=A0A3L6ZYR5_9HYPH|nr:serine--tRNA ligase [Xanthobacter tagetidis]MBB6310180.1 seryl-tRNA synthetase [Xanthobacter tagetidis]RLP72855.1 serine--tRNA ligase [Xanthobacter tagetidis]